MNFNFLGNFRISSKRCAAAIFLNSGTLAWFFLIQYNISAVFTSFSSNPFLVYVSPLLFYGFAAISAIAASLISRRVGNRKFLLFWIALGVLTTVLLTLYSQTEAMPFLSILMGLSLGLGLPSSMAYIANHTVVEERARVSGTTIFVTFGLTIIAMIIGRIFGFALSALILLIAIVRSISFLALVLDRFDGKDKVEEGSWTLELDYKDFAFYIIPWLMFILVGMLAWNLIPHDIYASAVSIGQILRFSCIAVFGLIAGFVADRFGRKPSIIMGFIVLGISFAILGYNISDMSVIIYLTASGIAWGSFFAIYLAVPGDLSNTISRERSYAFLTVLPLILLGSVPFIPGLANLGYSSSFSQILSLILFLSIIPVLRAKETLPDIKIRERRLKEHVEKVRKVVSESKKKE